LPLFASVSFKTLTSSEAFCIFASCCANNTWANILSQQHLLSISVLRPLAPLHSFPDSCYSQNSQSGTEARQRYLRVGGWVGGCVCVCVCSNNNIIHTKIHTYTHTHRHTPSYTHTHAYAQTIIFKSVCGVCICVYVFVNVWVFATVTHIPFQ
jgi:hypothetical protein